MTDDAKTPLQEAIQRERVRLLAEAEAEISRDMAEFERIALKYKIGVETFLNIIKAGPQPLADQGKAESKTAAPPVSAYDGTLEGLIDVYCKHEKSPFHDVKYSVQQSYLRSMRRLKKDAGSQIVATWSAEQIQNLHDTVWAANGKKAMGHDIIAKLRLLSSFGSTVLNDEASIRLSTILGNMRFATPKGDGPPRLTRDQARAIRITAREHFGWDSIALAIALLFEVPKLRQADVIGEWVPLSHSAKSDVMNDKEKWIRGLRWSDLDGNMVLHHLKRGRGEPEKVQHRLGRSQMVMEEINRVPAARRSGPMVICEFSGAPWSPNEFRRKLKIVAEKAGVSLRSQSTESDNIELDADEAS